MYVRYEACNKMTIHEPITQTRTSTLTVLILPIYSSPPSFLVPLEAATILNLVFFNFLFFQNMF